MGDITHYDVRRFLTDHEQLDLGLIEIILKAGRPITPEQYNRYASLLDKVKATKMREQLTPQDSRRERDEG